MPVRLFLAIPLPAEARRALGRIQRDLVRAGATGRFVPEENFHITLRFIGESDDVYALTSAMRLAVRGARSMRLRLCAYGFFAAGGGRTGFVSLAGDMDELRRLHETLEGALMEHGFARGRGRFAPHVTLGRNMAVPEGLAVYVEPVPFTADSLVLFESRAAGGRMQYTPLHREAF